MSQVVTLRFSVMPTLDALLSAWDSHGTVRHISATAVELCPTGSIESVILDYRSDDHALLLQGVFSEAAWSWVEEVRQRYGATLCEEEDGPEEREARLDWQRLSWYWKVLAIAGVLIFLPILLPLCVAYAIWQLGRLAFVLKK